MSLIMNCEPCGKKFTGPTSYNQHIKSDKHKRKVSSMNILGPSNEKKVLNTSEILSPSSNEHSRSLFECSNCSLRFDSFADYQTHSNSPEHAETVIKNAEMYGAKSKISLIIGPSVQPDKAENNSDIIPDKSDTILPEVEMMKSQASFSFCYTCKKSFSGREPYKQHIESAGHIKKTEIEKKIALGINMAAPEFSCAPCKKSFSGQAPYDQHMNSEIHRKKIQNLKLLERMEVDLGLKVYNSVLEPSPLNKENNPWYCKTCDIICSGPAPFDQHKKGATHLKKSLGAQLDKGTNDVLSNNHEIDGLNMLNGDIVLPGLMDSNENVRIAKLDESIKVFLPEEDIDFGEQNNKTNSNSAETVEMDFELSNLTNNHNFKLVEKNSDELEPIQIALNACSLSMQEKENIPEKKTEEKSDIYQTCNCCNVKLFSKDEAIYHYESLEHFQRRWSQTLCSREVLG